jgi:ketosteroid isomerase-like protein
MDRAAALELLDSLHAAQNEFYAGGADDALRALLTPNVTWVVPGANTIAGTYRGVDEVFDYFRRRRDLANSTFRLTRRDTLVGDGGRIAALTDGTAVIDGVERRWETVGLYDIADGRICGCWLLPLDAAEFDAIWSA